jgi:uncharacterized membrane protein
MNYACAAAMGAVCGLRTFTGVAITASAANHKVLNLKRTPLAWLAADGTAATLLILAAAEMIADKLPSMPDRIQPASLAARFVSGAVCGMAIAKGHTRRRQIMGAIVGGTAAVAAGYVGFQYRKRVKMPALAKALIEDTVAVAAARTVIANLCA